MPAPFPIVGIGASAGGLDACSELLGALPEDTGMAFIIVQHLAPGHPSILPDLLRRATPMPVEQVTDVVSVAPDHVYVIPPNARLSIAGRELHTSERPRTREGRTPIDFFFRSLAAYAGRRSVGVILSGMASDGARGMVAIKRAGGHTFVQDPETAAHDGMPRAAIAAGAADHVLSPRLIGERIGALARWWFEPPAAVGSREGDLPITDEQLAKIFDLLRRHTGLDFTHYKRPTVKRRLKRRLVLHKADTVDEYLDYLRSHPGEIAALQRDILIYVTHFFREPESFDALAEKVFPRIIGESRKGEAIRIWVPGCSTGEEAYSVAIALLEYLGDRAAEVPIQVFGTDVSDAVIEDARAGRYAEEITGEVSAERLRRFFTRGENGGYTIKKVVRDCCVFARHDLTRDPPFSHLDLIVCRNVLIYLGQPLQSKLIHTFHYALKSEGFLMLGAAEAVSARNDLFALIDKRHRVYARKPSGFRAQLELGPPHQRERAGRPVGAEPRAAARGETDVLRQAELALLDRFAPAGVVVDPELRVIQFRGRTGPYLEPAPGEATLNVLKMAREGLLHGLLAAVTEARQSQKPVRKERLRVVDDDGREVNLEVVPLPHTERGTHLLIVFEPVEPAPPRPAPTERPTESAETGDAAAARRRAAQLEEELEASRAYLQSVIQDLEATNEELQSTNEEILSSNEELQSTNEELDTAREELQSTNEEINTINDELHARNEELNRANGDLMNLLDCAHLAVVIVGPDLRIRRFTPVAEQALNLIPSDVGRPISDLRMPLDCPDIGSIITGVIDTMNMRDLEVRCREGRWHLLRVRPYRSPDDRIDGAVIALLDIDQVKRHQLGAQAAREFTDAIVDTVAHPLLVLDERLCVQRVNPACLEMFQTTEGDTVGRPFFEIGGGQWSGDKLRTLIEEVLPGNQRFEDFEVNCDLPRVGRKRLRINGRRLDAGERGGLVVLAIEEADRPTTT